MAAVYAKGTQAWPDNAVDLGTARVIKMYEEGYAGAFRDPAQSDALDQSIKDKGGIVDGADLAYHYGFAGDGAGKITVLFPAVVKKYKLIALTKPGQRTGDCVSMAGRDVSLFLICLEWESELPDEVSGKLEAPPDVSEKAQRNGVFVNETFYRERGHNGQGMSCSQGVRWVTTDGGILVRKQYDDVDLEEYNVNWEVKGKLGVPAALEKEAALHPVRDATRVRGHENARDYIDRGKPVWICMNMGWQDTRDEFGFSRQGRPWSHSIHLIGYDDRAETKQRYGFPLALVGHRWAVWNSGGRRIFSSQGMVPPELRDVWKSLGMVDAEGYLLIPEGYWWIDARLLDKVEMTAVSGAAGWEVATVPDFLGGF